MIVDDEPPPELFLELTAARPIVFDPLELFGPELLYLTIPKAHTDHWVAWIRLSATAAVLKMLNFTHPPQQSTYGSLVGQ